MVIGCHVFSFISLSLDWSEVFVDPRTIPDLRLLLQLEPDSYRMSIDWKVSSISPFDMDSFLASLWFWVACQH